MQEQVWLWIDRDGWRFLGGSLAGSFVGTPDETALINLVAAVVTGPTTVVLSPRLVFSFALELENEVTAMEAASNRFGLVPGAWSFHEHVTPSWRRIAAYDPSWPGIFEAWQRLHPGRLTLNLMPSRLGSAGVTTRRFRLGDAVYALDCDADGYVVAAALGGEADAGLQAYQDVITTSDWEWMAYESSVERTWRGLTTAARFLRRGLLVAVAAAAAAWIAATLGVRTLDRQIAEDQTFLSAHQREADAIRRIQEIGTKHWQTLRAKRDFSRNTAPFANDLAAMANLAEGRPIRWHQLIRRDQTFSLVVTGQSMSELLDYADALRALPRLEHLSVDELQSKTRLGRGDGELQIRLEGRVP